ncbi:RNA polymerase sigma-70 factor [Sunxiuqinia sp. A32]|uniref:RNA polymerase sigma-70 factor n=1 Tax=Sunxiuqinia sp. A32 TaxID=3461496 RepID=UPI004045239B
MVDNFDKKVGELDLFQKMKEGQSSAFDYFFERYYQGLCVYALKIVNSENISKDIVQDFFVTLWVNRKTLHVISNVKAYFVRSIHNRCLDHLAHIDIKAAHVKYQLAYSKPEEFNDYPLLDRELREQIEKEINKLPQGIRETFIKNRFDGLSYKQIADEENISVKTVEYRISKALTILRKALNDYLYLLLL